MAQMWNLQHREGGGDYSMMAESYHIAADDLGQQQAAMTLSEEVDGALLMQLMEDLPPSDLLDGDADRLSHVIRSLEAEIGGDGAAAAVVDSESVAGASSEDGDGCGLEDMLLDLDDGYGAGSSFGYWPEVPLVGHEADGNIWYVYTEGCEGGMVGYETMIDHHYHGVEGSAEQVYSPLWE